MAEARQNSELMRAGWHGFGEQHPQTNEQDETDHRDPCVGETPLDIRSKEALASVRLEHDSKQAHADRRDRNDQAAHLMRKEDRDQESGREPAQARETKPP